MKSTKAQTEIVGLMIIVVIISVGMLFYLTYSLSEVNRDGNVSDSIRKEYIDNELSMSFVQTLVRTTVPECNNAPLDVLIKDCGLEEYNIRCAYGDSCYSLGIVLEQEIVPETLDYWSTSYYLAVRDDTRDMVVIDKGCSPGTIGRRAPGVQPIPYYPEPGTAFLELAICNN